MTTFRALFAAAALAVLPFLSAHAQVVGAYPPFPYALTAGNCIKALNAFQGQDSGAPCGSGSVSSGLINQLAWYAASGSAVSGLATANNGTLVTSSGGVPSISSTLPNAVQDTITRVGALGTFGGAFSFTPANLSFTVSPTGSGTVTINPSTAGTINNVSIGATTATTGRFTQVTSTIATGTAPLVVSSTTNVPNLNASSLSGATFAAPGPIGSGTPSTGAFSTLTTTFGASSALIGAASNPENLVMGVGGSAGWYRFSNNATGFTVAVDKTRGADPSTFTTVQTGDQILTLNAKGADGAAYQISSQLAMGIEGTVSSGIVPGIITLSTANSSGVTTAALTLNSAQVATFGGGMTNTHLSTGTNVDVVCLSASGVFLIQAAVSCTISSKRFKDAYGTFDESGLHKVMALKPVLFKLKDGASNKDQNAATMQIGLYAEDVAAVDERLALYEPDMKTPKSYRQDGLLTVAIKAIQEQQAEIKNLKSRLARLERK